MAFKNNRIRLVIYLLILSGIIFGIPISCKKTAELPSLVTINITDITSSSITSGGLVFSTGGAPVITRGICVSTDSYPLLSDIATNDGIGPGSFTSSISGLQAGTTYYIRAYATNSTGTGYGNQYIITTTGELPAVTTTAASSVTSTTAVSGGEVLSDGGSAVTGRGVCWSTSPGPTTADNSTSDGSDVGIFSSSITGLSEGTKYYVRAYGTNAIGTGYGNEITFTTECNLPATPGVITGITNVAPNATGIVYTIPAVTGATRYLWTVPAGAVITSGQSTTSIIVNFGATGGNISVRAENYCGQSENTELAIIVAITNCGTAMDIEGNVYNTVTIGSQCWFAENLKTTSYRNGDAIFTETDDVAWAALTTGAYCWYNNDESAFKDIYGGLYNWYAATDSRSLCPVGWHVPTNGEWIELENYLIANGYNYDGTTATNKVAKSLASGTGWNFYPTEGAAGNTDYPSVKNMTGFTGMPGGVRDANEVMFGSIGNFGIWWSSSEEDATTAWDRGIDYRYIDLGRRHVNKSHGFSVRCLKD